MKLIVVIPTYNEAANIGNILARILAVDPAYHALVVDDNSPDGTAAVVAERAASDARIHLLLRRHERGFGTAVRDGFLEALRRGATLIGQMDADGSHDPAMFRDMSARLLRDDADAVIGSRYVCGGAIQGWGPLRYANSHVANRIARWVTGVALSDTTNGLRLFRREVLETIDLNALLSRGYSVILGRLAGSACSCCACGSSTLLFAHQNVALEASSLLQNSLTHLLNRIRLGLCLRDHEINRVAARSQRDHFRPAVPARGVYEDPIEASPEVAQNGAQRLAGERENILLRGFPGC